MSEGFGDPRELLKMYKRTLRRCKKRDLPLVKRYFATAYLESTLTASERCAYEEFQKQVHFVDDTAQRSAHLIIVPQKIAEKDALRALKLLQLQSERDLHVTWQDQPGKKQVLRVTPPRF